MNQKPTTEMLQFGQLTKLAVEILEKGSTPEFRAKELIEFLCKWFDCRWGTYWQVDEKRQVLRAIATWNKGTIHPDKLRNDTEKRFLSLDEGNAGLVWRSGKPICTSNLISDMCLPRSLDAAQVGLKVGIWFPIKRGQITFGVVELLGKPYWIGDTRFLNELTLLGLELGRSFKKQMEQMAC
jgi:hypothetical protein